MNLKGVYVGQVQYLEVVVVVCLVVGMVRVIVVLIAVVSSVG